MQQYFLGKEEDQLNNYHDNLYISKAFCDNKYFANQKLESQGTKKANIICSEFKECTFAKMGFKKATFKNVNFSFTVFIDCYFRYATFDNCNFTGAKFINCNFDQTSIIYSIFDYSKFENCYIKYDIMEGNLPRSKHNLCRYLCMNLGQECLKAGLDSEYLKYYYQGMKSSEAYNWEKFWHPSQPANSYFKKYDYSDKLIGLRDFTLSKINKILWGYGENVFRLLLNIMFTILLFAIILSCLYSSTITFWDCLFISISSFLSIGLPYSDFNVDLTNVKILLLIESSIGIVFIGFFIASLFRRISRR